MRALARTITTFSVGLCLLASVSSAAVVQVPSTNTTGAPTPVLDSGTVYLFVARGTYSYRDQDPAYWADAEFSDARGVGGVFQTEVYPTFSLVEDTLDLIIDGVAVDWLGSTDASTWAPHTFSPDHVYRYYYTGSGSAVTLSISDWSPFRVYPAGDPYSDNFGSLEVEISAIPEPTSLLVWSLLGAIAVIIGWWRRRRVG